MAGMKLYSLESNDPQWLGPYRLLRRIATGGMGRVYLARQEAPGAAAGGPGAAAGGRGTAAGAAAGSAGPTGTVVDHGLVAVKTLLAEGVVSRPDRERFAREVELAGRVNSAYTATVLDADARAERPWLAIEFVPAPSLAELVVQAGTLPADAVRWVAAGAARALAELHGLGVVHRDVKPLNILLPHDGPRLIDFGISHAHDHTSSTTTIGTFAFTSPEQACGRKSTAASDMYSLGATLFFLAVGRPPYEQTDRSFGILALVQRGEADTGGLPTELEPLILPLLEADPARRPAPSDVLRDVLTDLDRGPADGGAERRLPPAWTALIEEYAEQGRQLRDGTVDFDAAEAPTRMRSEDGPGDAGREISEMREQLEALRKQRDALVQAQAEEEAEAQAREFARQDKERRRREQARKEEERKEHREREQKARAAKAAQEAQAAREAKEARERERAAREKTETSAAARNKSTGTASAPAKKSHSSDGVGVLLVAALIVGVLVWQPWEKKDDDTPASSTTSGVTASSASGGHDGYGDSSAGSSSGGLDDTDTDTDTGAEPEPEPETSTPEPDPTEEAFQAVSYGDCLDVVDTGYGGTTEYDWSEEEPNTTSCGSGTRVKVTGTTGDCPSGVGKATWSYYSTSSGERTALCLTGQYHRGDCLLAKQEENDDLSTIAMLSSPNCTDDEVPVAYNQIVVVTDVYRATAGVGTEACRRGQYDTHTYWSTTVDDGATMLCLRAYD
jgi:hypothetical protein